MRYFNFTKSQKLFFGISGLVGVICLILSYFFDDDPLHTRFWSNFLLISTFFTGIGFLALFMLSASITALGGWITVFKRLWEALSLLLVPGLIMMLIIGVGNIAGFHHIYEWAQPEILATDELIRDKSAFLNNTWFMGATILFLGSWIFIAYKIRSLSVREDSHFDLSFPFHKKQKIWAAIFLPLGGFTSAALIWLWLMSVDPHWYSTLYAWYTGASWLCAMIALTILIIIYLKSRGYYDNITSDHLHDLGKYLFAFSIFWTYLWFSQFMLIWYANIGEETVYFHTRMSEYPVLFYGNLLLNFMLPFLVLMRNDTKRKIGTMSIVSIGVFFGHFWDFFQMLKPGVLHAAHVYHEVTHVGGDQADHGKEAAHGSGHAASEMIAGFTLPGILEVGIFLGFTALCVYFVLHQLSKAALMPKNDPYIMESLHHHV